ncbi:DNA-binding IclR family transcriptional regulator [Sulfitobacter undariae]|uniref:DNA-binding IclR family transcriptional regulator n=1 Tax=Sulfitobacter undariae TaxID=1563671 RepID=A0A7W6E5P8_9RHOB|nr:IclR family transcriptional regulator [Sulfitobacter undariae]MBB3995241.1 DNA-binding IclR family transcriptional regulator [Sulfitobacter undariae]
MTQTTKPARKGIQSLVTGFEVIDFLVRAGRPVPLREIATGTGLSPSKLQFYLVSLVEVRVVHQDPATGFYGLGSYTLQLGIAGLQQFDIFEATRTHLDAFAARHGHSMFLGVWGNEGPTVIYRARGQQGGSLMELRLGAVLPVLRSALGQLFLAHLPERITKDHIIQELKAGVNMPRLDDVPQSDAEIAARNAAILEQGISRCRGGMLSDHTSLSAPVFDYRGKIVAGVTLMAPLSAVDDDPDSAMASDLRDTAQAISREAGQNSIHYLDI